MSESWQSGNTLFGGPVEVDETCIGGKERNKRAARNPLPGVGVQAGLLLQVQKIVLLTRSVRGHYPKNFT